MSIPMGGAREAQIKIGDRLLSEGQSMAVRVAITNFLIELDDAQFRTELGPIADGYRDRLKEVMSAMVAAGLR